MTIEFLDNLDRKLFDGKRGDFSPVVGQMAAYSLFIALAMGICIVIAQFAVDGMEAQQNIVNVISVVGFAALIGLLVKLMLPLWKSPMSSSGKVLYTFFVGGVSFVCWLLGIVVIYLVVILLALWLGLKIWQLASGNNTNNSSQSSKVRGFRECNNCLHNRSQGSLNGFCDVKGKNVNAQDYCGNWDHC